MTSHNFGYVDLNVKSAADKEMNIFCSNKKILGFLLVKQSLYIGFFWNALIAWSGGTTANSIQY